MLILTKVRNHSSPKQANEQTKKKKKERLGLVPIMEAHIEGIEGLWEAPPSNRGGIPSGHPIHCRWDSILHPSLG